MSFQVGTIVPRITRTYRQQGLTYTFGGVLEDVVQHDEMNELFWAAELETMLRRIRGTRFYAVDLSMDQRYVQYLQVPAGNQPKTGWYVLRSFLSFANPTPQGLSFPFTFTCFFLGTNGSLVVGFKMFGVDVRRNDWGI